MKSRFINKWIKRIDGMDTNEVQALVARLAKEKGVLEKVFESLQEGVLLLDAQSKILLMNRATYQLFGVENQSLTGKRIDKLIRGIEWDRLAQSSKTVSRDFEIFYPENRYLNFYLTPLNKEGNEKQSSGYLLLIRDITDWRQDTEKQVEDEHLNALTLLAAGVAHEIGNPLNSMAIHLQLLDRKLKSLGQAERDLLSPSLRVARAEVTRLDGVLNQFLKAIRPNPVDLQLCDFHQLVEENLELLKPELTAKGILILLELSEDLPMIPLDPVQIKQVLFNLVKNACQAFSDQSLAEIRIKTQWNTYEICLIVEDNGSGISTEVMGVLFEPYLTTKTTGTGLGLLTVRRIIKSHGGQIEVESQIGKGTKVIVSLPRQKPRAQLLEKTKTQ